MAPRPKAKGKGKGDDHPPNEFFRATKLDTMERVRVTFSQDRGSTRETGLIKILVAPAARGLKEKQACQVQVSKVGSEV